MIDEEVLTTNLLVDKVHELYFTRQTFIDAMGKSSQTDSISTIMGLIEEAVTAL